VLPTSSTRTRIERLWAQQQEKEEEGEEPLCLVTLPVVRVGSGIYAIPGSDNGAVRLLKPDGSKLLGSRTGCGITGWVHHA